MSVAKQLDLFGFEEEDEQTKKRRLRNERRRRAGSAGYRTCKFAPVTSDTFAIVPEVAPILRELADICAVECPPENGWPPAKGYPGIGVLAARAALVLKIKEEAVLRRLHAVIHKKQLFINAPFIEGCLMAMDVEHKYAGRYSEWPANRAVALERVSLDAEYAGKQLSPTKLLDKANRLYEKGLRKALKHAPEVTP